MLAVVGDDEGIGVVLCSLDLSPSLAALVVLVSASEVAPASSCSSSTLELDLSIGSIEESLPWMIGILDLFLPVFSPCLTII